MYKATKIRLLHLLHDGRPPGLARRPPSRPRIRAQGGRGGKEKRGKERERNRDEEERGIVIWVARVASPWRNPLKMKMKR